MVPSGVRPGWQAILLPVTSEQQPRTGFGVAVPMSEPFGQYPHGQYSYGPGAYPVPEPPRRHRSRHVLGLTATAVVAAALGAGAAVGLAGGSSAGSAAATSKEMLSTTQIANRIDPALVDVTSTLGFQQA